MTMGLGEVLSVEFGDALENGQRHGSVVSVDLKREW